jgi:hypothetical protein
MYIFSGIYKNHHHYFFVFGCSCKRIGTGHRRELELVIGWVGVLVLESMERSGFGFEAWYCSRAMGMF